MIERKEWLSDARQETTTSSQAAEKPDLVTQGVSRLSLSYIYVAFAAFGLAAVAGLLQGLVRGGMIQLPFGIGYYEILTAHGVLMGLVFTTFFIIGFMLAGVAKTTGGLTRTEKSLGWWGWILMMVGTSMGVVTILGGEASVLYTFYAPLKASPYFYIGATLLIVGSWLGGAAMVMAYRRWRKAHKGQVSPLFTFMAVTTMALWYIATIGVAVEVLFQLIPWSFGWVDTINVLLSRTLFWYFGHPLVYFWLMPAYMAWYVIVPKVIGGNIFSDPLARLAFILFLLFSIPVGFHHQLMEPGIHQGWKFVHVVLTLIVAVPSLMTAFSMFAVFESAGRQKGGKGLFGWFKKLPWGDVRFFAPFVGMLWFVPAGAGGIINASNQLNEVVHNTIWVTGHFHLTVGTTVALTFFGVAYWLIPHLTGRKLTRTANRLGILQTVMWSVGMFTMSGAMHYLGLKGAPRRTAFMQYPGDDTVVAGWLEYHQVMAVGGVFLFLAAILLIGLVIYLGFLAPKGTEEFPIGATAESNVKVPAILERWPVWIGILAFLIVTAYAIPIWDQIQHAPPGSPPFKTW